MVDGLSTNDATWAGTKVVRKAWAPPSTENDGVLIIDNTNRDKYRNTYFIDDTATQTAYAFYDVDNNIADKIYVGVYQATIENGELFSNSGKNANVKYSLNQIFDACRARGRNYLPYSFMIHQLLVFLYMMRFRTRSPFENLTLSTNTWKNETGVFNQNGMWFKSDGGKFAGIEWAISSSYLYLAGAKLSSDVSGTVYRQNIVILEPRNFYTVNVTQAGWLTKSQYSYYNNASGVTNSQCSGFSGYTKYVDARNAIMFPSSDQSGGSLSTYFCSYMSDIPQTTANSDLVLCVHLYYSGAYKGFLNLCGAVNSTVSASYSTYLTYIKGESQQWENI